MTPSARTGDTTRQSWPDQSGARSHPRGILDELSERCGACGTTGTPCLSRQSSWVIYFWQCCPGSQREKITTRGSQGGVLDCRLGTVVVPITRESYLVPHMHVLLSHVASPVFASGSLHCPFPAIGLISKPGQAQGRHSRPEN